MTIQKAISSGKPIYRIAWGKTYAPTIFVRSINLMIDNNGQVEKWNPDLWDILADDWEVRQS